MWKRPAKRVELLIASVNAAKRSATRGLYDKMRFCFGVDFGAKQSKICDKTITPNRLHLIIQPQIPALIIL